VEVPPQAATPALQPLLDRVLRAPRAVQPHLLAGVRRMLDYQDEAYARLYLDRVERVLALEAAGPAGDSPLGVAVARGLALWMSFEDTIRVADLKTRGTRLDRVRSEAALGPDQLLDVVEFLHPRVEEIAGTLPAGLGRWLLRSPRAVAVVDRFTHDGRQVRTSSLTGFLMLRVLASFRRVRRSTLRYTLENEQVEAWLAVIGGVAPRNQALAVEVARLQRLVKGYGETHARGGRKFARLVAVVDDLITREDGAAVLARLHEAALADDEGAALDRELAALTPAAPRTPVLA
jgi:indolepyruvate ferredoxin oxidoreductase beta subunit